VSPRWFQRIAWFGVVGGGSALAYAASVAAAIELLGSGRQIANILGLVASSLCSYLGHHYLTFQADSDHGRYFPRFMIQIALTYLLSAAATYAVARMHWPYAIGIVTVLVAIPAVNFVMLQTWVFAKRPC
jgi:putative flippase GtrA